MNLLIRSQDKTNIANFNTCCCIGISHFKNSFQVNYQTSEGVFFLGEYSTKEKALKVLDMVEKEYLKYARIESGYGVQGVFEIPKVFKMPADNEVQVGEVE